MLYDPQNIFARILRKELPCTPVLETPYTLSFYDLYPKAPTHVLVIPKGPYKNIFHFHEKASDEEIVHFYKDFNNVIQKLRLQGFRIVSNTGVESGQIVDHFHVHILGGKILEEAP